MNKKLIAVLLAVAMMISTSSVFAAYSVSTIDYSDELSQIETLLNQCESKGLSVEYEKVNYYTIKDLSRYVQDEINSGASESRVNYNIAFLDNLCTETITALQAYKNGTKQPLKVYVPDTADLMVEGDRLTDGNNTVFSIGSGHIDGYMTSLDTLNGVGLSNMQIHVSPATLYETDVPGWGFEYKDGDTTTTAVIENESMKLTKTDATGYLRLVHQLPVKPNTTYTYGLKVKGQVNERISFLGNDWSERNEFPVSSDTWVSKDFTLTTGDSQNLLIMSVIIDRIGEVYIDDVYLKEVGTSENLVRNSDFSSTDKYLTSISPIINNLQLAEMYDMGVSLLISPHLIPEGIENDGNLYGENFWFNHNMNHEKAKAVTEEFIDTLLPYVVQFDSLDNICLANEPDFDTRVFPNFYNPLFREYLLEKHGSLDGINAALGKSYGSIDSISMPSSLVKDGFIDYFDSETEDSLVYEWIEFNDKNLADWHKWLKSLVREYTNIPLGSKVMNYFREDYSASSFVDNFSRGTDLELINEASDYAGNDVYDVPDVSNTYKRAMFCYDYLSSITGKPIYNSEDHFISDGDETVSNAYRAHTQNHYWMSAVHGMSMSTAWTWATDPNAYPLLRKPEILNQMGHTALDLARLSNELTELRDAERNVAIFYSKPTMVYDWDHSPKMFEAYGALINAGQKVGVVTEKSLSQLGKYDMIILPEVGYGSADAVSALTAYLNNGGKVLYTGSCMTKDEYRKSQTSTGITNHANATSYSSTSDILTALANNGLSRVTVKDTSGNAVTGLDMQYSMNEHGDLLVNISNVGNSSTKTVNVYLDGTQITGMTDLITGTEDISTVSLPAKEPVLLRYEVEIEDSVISNPSADVTNGRIVWDNSEGRYNGADVYKMDASGEFVLVATTAKEYYSVAEAGIYAVRNVGDTTPITKADWIYAGASDSFDLAVTKMSSSGNSVTATVTIKNNSSTYAHAVTKFEVLDAEGNVVEYHYQAKIFKGGESDSFKISISRSGGTNVKVSVVNTIKQNDDIAEAYNTTL